MATPNKPADPKLVKATLESLKNLKKGELAKDAKAFHEAKTKLKEKQ